MLTIEQLRKVMPILSIKKAEEYLPHLLKAMEEVEINTPKRIACWLAQLAHESCQFKFMKEIWGPTPQQLKYEDTNLAKRLGNTEKGDGFKYRGRGPIQLTGRANYRACGKALGIDLENNPDEAAKPSTAFRVAGWYWKSRNLNSFCDNDDFEGLTRKINGATNGLQDRKRYWEKAKEALGVK